MFPTEIFFTVALGTFSGVIAGVLVKLIDYVLDNKNENYPLLLSTLSILIAIIFILLLFLGLYII